MLEAGAMSHAIFNKIGNIFEVAGWFLRLGVTAFGGPAAHIALMEQEVVVRRGWLSRAEFLDLLGTVNVIPGSKPTEMAILIGYRRAGWLGLLLAGICFILPAALIVTAIAWAYVNYGKLPQAEGVFYGIKPVIIAVMVQAIWHLARTAVKTPLLAIVGAGAIVAGFYDVNLLLILLISGLFMLIARAVGQASKGIAASGLTPLWGTATGFRLLSTAGTMEPFSLWPMALFFLKVGAVMFGSGYVLVAFLHTDLVEHRQWLTESQLLDAVAIGQFTPGPFLSTATFVGYVLGGPQAALVATVAVFLPSFVFCVAVAPFAARLRQSRLVAGFIAGVNVASLALMVVVTWRLGFVALVDWLTISLGVAAAVWLLFYRVNSTWLILGGAAVGLARFVFENGF
jgi:chromate transporter